MRRSGVESPSLAWTGYTPKAVAQVVALARKGADVCTVDESQWCAPNADLALMALRFGYEVTRLPGDPHVRVARRVYLKPNGFMCVVTTAGDLKTLCVHGHGTACCSVEGCPGGSGCCRHGLLRAECSDERCQRAGGKRKQVGNTLVAATTPELELPKSKTRRIQDLGCPHTSNKAYCSVCPGGGASLCIHRKKKNKCPDPKCNPNGSVEAHYRERKRQKKRAAELALRNAEEEDDA